MQARQAATPPQSAIAAVHAPPMIPGHAPACHPTSASGTSSPPLPQRLSFPPHALAIRLASLVVALASAATVAGSSRQTVARGSLPERTLAVHVRATFAAVFTNVPAAPAIAALQSRACASAV